MKLGYDAKRLFSNFTGLGNYSRSLLSTLVARFPENEYNLYAPRLVDREETDEFIGNDRYRVHTSTLPLKSVWRSYSVVNDLKRDGIDLYHGLSNELPFTIHRSGIKSIVTIHDLIFKRYPSTYPLIDREIYDIKFRHSCRNADRVVAISQSTKDDIVHYYGIDPDKIEVIYQACDPLYYSDTPEGVALQSRTENRPLLKVPDEYLLSVGSVIERKNLLTVVEAYRHLPESMRIPLVIVGRGKAYRQRVVDRIGELGLERHFIWFDSLDDNRKLAALYAGARALLYPSLYEGFGLPVAEALLCRTPVITSSTSSLPEAGGPSSLYVDPLNAEEIAHAISRVLADEELRSRMITDGYNYARQTFSPERLSRQMMACYRAV